MSRIKLWTGLVVLFAAGALTGVVGTCLYHDAERSHRGERGPGVQHERIMKRLTRELSLTPAQQAAVDPVVSRTHAEILELRLAHQPEIDAILTKAMADLKVTLSPEQQAQLDGMYARLQQRWQKSRDHLDEARKRASVQRAQ